MEFASRISQARFPSGIFDSHINIGSGGSRGSHARFIRYSFYIQVF
jgi:hypothetical protein